MREVNLYFKDFMIDGKFNDEKFSEAVQRLENVVVAEPIEEIKVICIGRCFICED